MAGSGWPVDMGSYKTIGVIGGMGPAATAWFQNRLIALTSVSDDQDHIPLLIDMNPQIPSRIAALTEKGSADPGRVLAQMAKRLEDNGAHAIVMPCNTAHYYSEEIIQDLTIPFLNMVELAACQLFDIFERDTKIGMLASPITDQCRVFQKAFDRYDLAAVYPQNSDKVLTTIRDIKSNGVSEHTVRDMEEYISELTEAGVDGFLIGCSEFSMLGPQIQTERPVFDSVDLLARAAIKYSRSQLDSQDRN